MEKIDKSSLAYLGSNAQAALIKCMLEDKKQFNSAIKYLNPKSFTDTGLKMIVQVICDYYENNKIAPTYKDIEYAIKYKCSNDDEMCSAKRMYQYIRDEKTLQGMYTAANVCLNGLKQIEVQRILDNAKRATKDKEFNPDSIAKYIEELSQVCLSGNNNSIESPSANELFDMVFSYSKTDKIKTGITELDEQLKGGFQRGTVSLIIAATGCGKTTLSSIIAMKSAIEGNNVLHIFFEDTLVQIGQKYYSTITGLNSDEFDKDYNRLNLIDFINERPKYKKALYEHIKPMRLINGETTFEDIREKITECINSGWKPDMVVIDYISCIQSSSNKNLAITNEVQAQERLMKKIETLAQDLNIHILTLQQTNRDGVKVDTAMNRIGNVQGSFRMTQPCSYIMYLDRTQESTDYNSANLYLDKCRGSKPKQWTNIYLNNGNCKINLSARNNTNDSLCYYEDENEPSGGFKVQ